MDKLYDVVIIGGGPAGVSAAVYTASKQLNTVLITESFGGQSIVSDEIENWIGERKISGLELAHKVEAHVRAYEEKVDIKLPERATKIEAAPCQEDRVCDFKITTDLGNTYYGRTAILAMGAHRRRLDVPGEEKFEGKGVSYCATCDAPLFTDKKVAVIGGGNAGVEAAIDLLPFATEIYLLQRGDKLTADPFVVERIKSEDRVEIIFGADTKKIIGDKFVEGLIYVDKKGAEKKLEVGGILVEIGSVPNSDSVKDLVKLDPYDQVVIDSKHATTSQPGVFAAGDITDDPYKQNNISAGDAVKAALAAYAYIQKLERRSPATEV